MTRGWMEQRERGSGLLLRLMVWIALRLGRPVAGLLLYPICAYFTLFSARSRRASRQYLARIGVGLPGLQQVFRHYHTFAATILHRVYFLAGQYETFDVRVHGVAPLERLVSECRGCLLVGAHLGSFEVLRALGILHRGLSLKMLMYQRNAQNIGGILDALNPQIAASVINVGVPGALLGLNEHLERGGLVALLGDRAVQGEKRVRCRFLGDEALFPIAPVALASVLEVPVILAFGLYRGGNRYDVHFELLAERLTLDRQQRKVEAQQWMQRYAERLEHYCRLAPYNWFNFYDFWDGSEEHGA
jgi:predicted LPLAT superfamily acyltransferase